MEQTTEKGIVVVNDPERLIDEIEAVANELHAQSLFSGDESLRALAGRLRAALDNA